MEPQPAERRRQRQRHEARTTILEAAEGLLMRSGYDGFSMRRLAERCGYTTPTIYHYFRDKNGLIDAILEPRFQELLERMRRVPQGEDPVENWRQMTLAFIAFAQQNPTHYRLLMTPRENREPAPVAEQLVELMGRPFSELEASGRLIPSDGEAARQALWAMVHGLISLTTTLPNVEWSGSLIDTVVAVLQRGLVREPGARS